MPPGSRPRAGKWFKEWKMVNEELQAIGPLAPATASKGRILFVDDEASIRDSSTEALRGQGYDVVPCKDGIEAVAYYRESWEDVDVVVLDLMMPKMSGHDTFLATQDINPGVKVVLLSGFSLDARVQAVLDAGALDYVKKPFRLAKLYEAVARALSSENDAT